jgi:hypothetical protein
MTKEGHEWVEATSGKMISTIKTALDANQTTVTFIQQHFKAIEIGLGGFIVASGLAKLGEMAKGIGEIFNIGRAMINIASGTITGAGAAQAEGATGGGILGFLSRNAGVTSVVGAIAAGIYEARESEKWSRTHAAEIISEERARTAKGGTVGTEWATANFPDSPAMREYAAKHQENAAAVDKATAATNNAVPALESGRFRGVRVKGARVRLGKLFACLNLRYCPLRSINFA